MNLLYFLVLALELLGEYLASTSGNYNLVYIVKPLLMPILMALLFAKSVKPLDLFLKLVLAALFFSWLGDILLMLTWSGPDLFVFGLAAFLIAHVCYIVAFRPGIDDLSPGYLFKKPVWGMLLLTYCVGLIYALYASGHPDFESMNIPVVVYATIILLMSWSALDRKGRVNQISFKWILSGALLFLLSDSMIALNKFTDMFADRSLFIRVAIMFTYGVAQYMIVRGSLKRSEA